MFRYLLILVLATAACSPKKEQVAVSFINIQEFGADTALDNNAPQIQNAIDKAHEQGGGEVFIPAGTFSSGGLFLRSNVTLRLANGARLLGMGEQKHYQRGAEGQTNNKTHPEMALISAIDQENISLIGEGIIDGNGKADSFACYPIPNHPEGAWHKPPRPAMVRFVDCKKVRIQDLHFTNGATWGIHIEASDYLQISGVEVFNHSNANNDGIDIDACQQVTISDCIIDSDDDALVFKAKGSKRSCRDITVTNCILASKTNALKTGTESRGGFQNMTITNIQIRPSLALEPYDKNRDGSNFCGICLATVDGGLMENIAINNVQISGSPNPLFVRLGNRNRKLKSEPKNEDESAIRNVYLSHILADTCGEKGMLISGTKNNSIQNIHFSDCVFNIPGGYRGDSLNTLADNPTTYPYAGVFGKKPYPGKGLTFRYVDGIYLSNVRFVENKPDKRPKIFYLNSTKPIQ